MRNAGGGVGEGIEGFVLQLRRTNMLGLLCEESQRRIYQRRFLGDCKHTGVPAPILV
jgi:hypothetical protein